MFFRTLIVAAGALVFALPAIAAPYNSPESVRPTRTVKRDSFVHPGVFLNTSQLDFIKTKVNAGSQPWESAYTAMTSDSLFDLDRVPSPVATVECGPTSTPDIGCTAERQDGLSAYAMSLAWVITGEQDYADQAINIMNAWAPVIKAHTDSNAKLQTGWAGANWARAAEIIRHTDAGWSDDDISAFETMLADVYLPTLLEGAATSNGNWELVMMEAAIGISVFLDDTDSYNSAMDTFLGRVPAYVYLLSDGDYPVGPPNSGIDTESEIESYWQGQTQFLANGIAQETCRDFTHTGYGIASISHVCETSKIQGTDLYQEDTGTRLRYALGFHSQYQLGASVPSWLCDGSVNLGLGPVTEVGYNALAIRDGYSMTNTHTLTLDNRPAADDKLFVAFETLTHALTDS